MPELVEPLECEGLLSEAHSDEMLFRQIPDHNWDDRVQRPLSHAFGPADVDKRMASHSRSSVVSAAASQEWHNEHAAKRSVSVWGYSVTEVLEVQGKASDGSEVVSQVIDDSGCTEKEGGLTSPGHCYVDYRHLMKPGEKVLRGLLFIRAMSRGALNG